MISIQKVSEIGGTWQPCHLVTFRQGVVPCIVLILPRTKEVLTLCHVRISDSVNKWSCIRRNEEDGQEEFGANSTGVEDFSLDYY